MSCKCTFRESEKIGALSLVCSCYKIGGVKVPGKNAYFFHFQSVAPFDRAPDVKV